MTYRGIKQETLDLVRAKAQVGEKKIFPIFSAYGQLIGKVVHQPKSKSLKYWKEVDERFVGFNMQSLPKLFYGKPLVIVEGIYDCLTLIQEGVDCMAMVASKLNRTKLKQIYRYTNRLIICPDSDRTGDRSVEEMTDLMDKMEGYDWKYSICKQMVAKDINELYLTNPSAFNMFMEELKRCLD